MIVCQTYLFFRILIRISDSEAQGSCGVSVPLFNSKYLFLFQSPSSLAGTLPATAGLIHYLNFFFIMYIAFIPARRIKILLFMVSVLYPIFS